MAARTEFTPGLDPYERIAEAIREALPGAAGEALFARIADELAAAAEEGQDDAGTAYERLQIELERALATDVVTGLPNLRRFTQDLTHAVAAAQPHDQPLGVIVVRVDDEIGEDEEQALGESFLRLVRITDVVARIAPRTFAVMLSQAGATGVALVAERLHATTRLPLALGTAVRSPEAASAEALLDSARRALPEHGRTEQPPA